MSNVPYADLGETSGESARELKNSASFKPDFAANDDDQLSETGDIGISDKVYASYQVIISLLYKNWSKSVLYL